MDPAALALDADGDVLLANRAARELGLINEGRVVAELEAVIRTVAADRAARQLELDLTLPGGSSATVALAARVIPAGGGGTLVLASDLSESRLVDAVRQDFVANVSHELKTPVGALMLLAEAIETSRDDPDTLTRFTDQLRREASRLTRLVQELIDLSRLQGAQAPPSPKPVPVAALINDAVERVGQAAHTRQIRITRRPAGRVNVLGDHPQLVTALSNLLDNAIAYSPEGANVVVSARRSPGQVSIDVADQGIGIAPEHQQRVFERFYRVDPARSRATGGTGLGLAIVKHIAANHGGRVELHSELGRGSTFTLTLPASRPGAAP